MEKLIIKYHYFVDKEYCTNYSKGYENKTEHTYLSVDYFVVEYLIKIFSLKDNKISFKIKNYKNFLESFSAFITNKVTYSFVRCDDENNFLNLILTIGKNVSFSIEGNVVTIDYNECFFKNMDYVNSFKKIEEENLNVTQ